MRIFRPFLLWFMQSQFYSWLLLHVIPFIRFSVYYTRLRGKVYNEGHFTLSPGDFVLCLDEQKLTALLVPGFMTHAAFCVSNKRDKYWYEYECAEMTHKDFTKSDFFDLCKESSRVLICTCIDWTENDKERLISAVRSFQSAKYDVEFELGVKSLYCSELVYQADQKLPTPKLEVDLSDLCGLGRPYLSPDGLLFAKNTKVKWDSDKEMGGMYGPQAEQYCRKMGYIK